MRIDSSGNLLLGKTSGKPTTLQQALRRYLAGLRHQTRDGAIALILNRLTSDGDIAVFRKNGTTVGSIGTLGGDFFISNSDTGLRYRGVEDNIIPCDGSGGSRDNAVSLGGSPYRFKNLYLSGGVVPWRHW